jgi:hypothetical protein
MVFFRYLCSPNPNIDKHIMATPIRFAPVLTGKDAEEFYERWQHSLKKPAKVKFCEKENEKVKNFITKYNLH